MTRLRGERDILHGANAAERDGGVRDVGEELAHPRAASGVPTAERVDECCWDAAGKNFALSCAIKPAIPFGATRSTANSKKAERKQAVFGQVSNSGNCPCRNAPMIGPGAVCYRSSRRYSSRIDCRKGNELGLMPSLPSEPRTGSRPAPSRLRKSRRPSSAREPDQVPIERVATSESLAARMA